MVARTVVIDYLTVSPMPTGRGLVFDTPSDTTAKLSHEELRELRELIDEELDER